MTEDSPFQSFVFLLCITTFRTRTLFLSSLKTISEITDAVYAFRITSDSDRKCTFVLVTVFHNVWPTTASFRLARPMFLALLSR